MSQQSPKESQTIPPPPLVARKQPESEPASKKQLSPKDETASQQPNEQVKKDNKTQQSTKPPQQNRRDREEEPIQPVHQRQRSRSRSRNAQRKNFNRDGDGRRDNRDRFDRDNRDNRDRYNGRKTYTKAARRRDFDRQDDMPKQATYFKTKLCPAYQMGKCHKQGKCTFAHGQQELKEMPNFKKTKLCIEYNYGKCPFSSRECKYAHGQAELKGQNHEGRHHRDRHNHQAQMRKYRINPYESYAPSNTSYSNVPSHHSSYSHSAINQQAPVYPPTSYQPPVHMPHSYGRNPSSSDNWAGYNPGWVPPRTDMGPSTFPNSFDPLSSTASVSYRPWEYNPPASNVAVGRTDAGLSGSLSFGAPNPSSFSGGFSGSGPTHFTSSTGSAVYSGSSGQFNIPNPPSAPSGPFMSIPTYHRPSGENSNSFEAFSMGMGSDMLRRPMPSDR